MGFVDVLLALITWDNLRGIWSRPEPLDLSHVPTRDQTQETMNRRNAVMCWHCPERVWWNASTSMWVHAGTDSPTAPTPDDGYGPYDPHIAQPDSNYPGFFPFDSSIKAIQYKYSSRRNRERT